MPIGNWMMSFTVHSEERKRKKVLRNSNRQNTDKIDKTVFVKHAP